MEVMSLEISEITHKHKLMIAVGTITQRAENFAARGALYIIDIITVVPEPGHPETGKKLQIHGREDTKGGITALTGIAGLVATAQGMLCSYESAFLAIVDSSSFRSEDDGSGTPRGQIMSPCRLP